MDFWFRLPLRTRLGIISSVLVVCAVVILLFWYHDPVRFAPYRSGWVLRFGPLVFLLWLAWSDLTRIPWWSWIIILVMLIVCAVKPSFWIIGIPAIGYILFARRKK